jgi:hypothetical protein
MVLLYSIYFHCLAVLFKRLPNYLRDRIVQSSGKKISVGIFSQLHMREEGMTGAIKCLANDTGKRALWITSVVKT